MFPGFSAVPAYVCVECGRAVELDECSLLADMANQEHLNILAKGVETWNAWRQENPNVVPDLPGAHVRRAILIDANLRSANLSGARIACLASSFRRRDELSESSRNKNTHHGVFPHLGF